MRILVYGSGVIGSIFGGKLAAAGHHITMLARGNRYDELSDYGVVLQKGKPADAKDS